MICASLLRKSISLAIIAMIGFLVLMTRKRPFGHKLQCVSVIESSISREGVGEFIRRNQLAFFLADRYSARISFPDITSSHGYEVHNLFSSCKEESKWCTLRQGDMIIDRCPRADCRCLWRESDKYIHEKARACNVLSLRNDALRTMEYSGCLRNVLSSYFTSDEKHKDKKAKPYQVLHYRAGDLKKHPGGKSISMVEMFYILDTMCRTSEHDIIILTEGRPKIPDVRICRNRLVLAGNTSLNEAFMLVKHAKTVSVGDSSFAIAMMEVARPDRIVLLTRSVPTYEWVDCARWTILDQRGVPFHFHSKRLMLEAVISGRPTAVRSHRLEQQVVTIGTRVKLKVLERIWRMDEFFE